MDDVKTRLEAGLDAGDAITACAFAEVHKISRNLAFVAILLSCGGLAIILDVVFGLNAGRDNAGGRWILALLFLAAPVLSWLFWRNTTEQDCIVGVRGNEVVLLFDPDRTPTLEAHPLSQVGGELTVFGRIRLRLPRRALTLRVANLPGNREQANRI